ncbi:MAG: hypothetical protein MJZ74_09975, partial [Muribaculaceae bacterium]|nr:hypothetical protein [Muribaculaceae bacterium]
LLPGITSADSQPKSGKYSNLNVSPVPSMTRGTQLNGARLMSQAFAGGDAFLGHKVLCLVEFLYLCDT